jgi:CheY-like chemotaxis protein
MVMEEQNLADALEVLFIEDDQHFAETYKLRLELDGYRVLVAGDQREALRLLGSRVPDLIFLDVDAPGLDAWEVLEVIREDVRTRYVPVIILTPYGQRELLKSTLDLKSHDHTVRVAREASGKVLVGPWFPARGHVPLEA